jgi:hypothetical protein
MLIVSARAGGAGPTQAATSTTASTRSSHRGMPITLHAFACAGIVPHDLGTGRLSHSAVAQFRLLPSRQ